MWVRALIVWLVIIVAESIHGALRQYFVAPIAGDFSARQISVLTGTALIFAIAWLFRRWTSLRDIRSALYTGSMWVVLTVAFEISLGRTLGFEWKRLWSDYDLAHGGLIGLGLLAMLLTPLVVMRLSAIGKNDAGRGRSEL